MDPGSEWGCAGPPAEQLLEHRGVGASAAPSSSAPEIFVHGGHIEVQRRSKAGGVGSNETDQIGMMLDGPPCLVERHEPDPDRCGMFAQARGYSCCKCQYITLTNIAH